MSDDDTTHIIRRKNVEPAAEDPEKTRIIRRTPPPIPDEAAATLVPDDDKTRVYGQPKAAEGAGIADITSPVVGWLVVLKGPGRGKDLALGFGMNQVGRSASNRVILDFGDEEVSRKAHTTVTYDPRGRKFYLQPGSDATNLTYLGKEPDLQPVLAPVELKGGELITLGQTTLVFVAFCGPGFSWE